MKEDLSLVDVLVRYAPQERDNVEALKYFGLRDVHPELAVGNCLRKGQLLKKTVVVAENHRDATNQHRLVECAARERVTARLQAVHRLPHRLQIADSGPRRRQQQQDVPFALVALELADQDATDHHTTRSNLLAGSKQQGPHATWRFARGLAVLSTSTSRSLALTAGVKFCTPNDMYGITMLCAKLRSTSVRSQATIASCRSRCGRDIKGLQCCPRQEHTDPTPIFRREPCHPPLHDMSEIVEQRRSAPSRVAPRAMVKVERHVKKISGVGVLNAAGIIEQKAVDVHVLVELRKRGPSHAEFFPLHVPLAAAPTFCQAFVEVPV
eukprot:CAMPEP_0117548618 /NCGR_PEP_ID=MMETSP0784-20121206/47743_1 /TAXON_ID=39447 /ORGANISM="" /LENGTH=323 /DNA_ID=CAMNT_0005345581 /DNA_START=24 /DNA_END=996 /DNA_ORIENTATION=+